jgi:hypothetical protein
MHVPRRVFLTLLLLMCALAALAQEPPAAKSVDTLNTAAVAAESILEAEHMAVQKAEEQEHATEQAEHAPISHEKPPAALEDVDEFKGDDDDFTKPKTLIKSGVATPCASPSHTRRRK